MKKVNYNILDPRGFLEFKNDNRIINPLPSKIKHIQSAICITH